MLTFIALHYDERLFHVERDRQLTEQVKARLDLELEKTRRVQDFEKELGDIRTQMSAINLRLGIRING